MEPFEPELRAELKAAHPGLTDADLSELEAALAARQEIDRGRRPAEAAAIDARWRAAARRAPRLREVMLAFDRRRIAADTPRPKPPVRVRRRDQSD